MYFPRNCYLYQWNAVRGRSRMLRYCEGQEGHLGAIHKMKWCVLTVNFVAASMLSGCASSVGSAKIYLHDEARLTSATAAKSAFAKVTADGSGLWGTMQSNLELSQKQEVAARKTAADLYLTAVIQNVHTRSWSEIRECANDESNCAASLCPDPRGQLTVDCSDQQALAAAAARIKKLATEIETLGNSPNSVIEGKAPPTTAPSKQLQDLINTPATEVKKLEEKANAIIAEAEGKLEKISDNIAFGPLRDLIAILRKAKDVDLIHEFGIEKLSKATDTPLPKDLSDALKTYTGEDIKTAGALIDFLAASDTSLHEIRLSLLREAEQTAVEYQQAELELKRSEIEIWKRRARVLGAKQEARTSLATMNKETYPSDKTVYQTLQDLSNKPRSAGAIRMGDRTTMVSASGYLATYVNIKGFLGAADEDAKNDLIGLEHRRSIARSAVAARARERMIGKGLDGIVVFEQGGITPQQIANLLSALQVTGISLIAAGVH